MATPDVSVHMEEVVVVTTPDGAVDGGGMEEVKTVLVTTNLSQHGFGAIGSDLVCSVAEEWVMVVKRGSTPLAFCPLVTSLAPSGEKQPDMTLGICLLLDAGRFLVVK
ncbi:hypothetical protein BTVI_104602 [Pitangus sulphuratus]|nr:hypothetical protein BTVI_104602 [Pitangus sulphuratus]